MVAKELRSQRVLRIWEDDLVNMKHAPFPTDKSSLYVAYFATAELDCHLALGWGLPVALLDLYPRFRNETNGLRPIDGNSLIAALQRYGISEFCQEHKDHMRTRILQGGPWTQEEQREVLDYCESDVIALEQLLPHLAPKNPKTLGQSLHHGLYLHTVSKMQHRGIPVDTESLDILKSELPSIRQQLVRQIDVRYEVYDGLVFKTGWFENLIKRMGISAWPRTESGMPSLEDDVFHEMAIMYPYLAPLYELRGTLRHLRNIKLAIGPDGRNRTLLSPFRAVTSRNQPSNAEFIFGPVKWIRGFIKPDPGMSLIYADWGGQEVGIAAVLSRDGKMQEAYLSTDLYLTVAIMAGMVPKGATKETHKAVRNIFKTVLLGLNYGMSSQTLALRIGKTECEACSLIDKIKRLFPRYFRWTQDVLNYAYMHNMIWTHLGWTRHIEPNPRPNSIQNFPMQATGADILRHSCILMDQAGINLIAPIHDAVLVEAPTVKMDDVAEETKQLMVKGGADILDGFPLKVDVKRVDAPGRYMDDRGREMWDIVWSIIGVNPDKIK